ncbi:hypothetical protein ACB092_02G059500 [Castanea dentata]
MAMKVTLFVSLMVAALAIPISGVQALGYDILIYGTVYCPSSSSIGANGINKRPIFPNAEIHVMCGGQVASSAYTNGNGKFLFSMDHQRYTVPIILKICNLVVISPLSRCPKPTLGHLESSLNYVGDTISGDLKISSIIPVGFHIVP